jgi:hypothetical protein
MANIYVASSWRNNYQQDVVLYLRSCGYEVYDFKNPAPGVRGFHWSDIDPDWKNWTPKKYREALQHPIAKEGFKRDKDAMDWADACVLVLPSGRSAHLEAGQMSGEKKLVCTYIPEDLRPPEMEPELMYKLMEDPDLDEDHISSFIAITHEEIYKYLDTFLI